MSSVVFPKRIFAAGEEPSGERVNSYHRARRTESIIDALDPEELAFLKNSTFAKVIALDENPPFSGAFGHFILVRRLKTNKKYEIWILFAGYPIRFSLREFAIVTGLNFGKVPESTRRKRKNPLNEKLYWNELFGSLKSCSIEMVVDMLKNRKVKDRDMRIKYACLAITSSVLLPSSHSPKIIPEHVELIRDIDQFMAYPWGRVSFQLLMSSLLKKDEIALAQDSFSLRGYVDAIQLVMIAAVPALKEEVVPNQPLLLEESESETEESVGDDAQRAVETGVGDKPPAPARFVINPKNARDLNAECKVNDNFPLTSYQ
ncbi:hypothetical protein Bca52824_034622 [Brassica carinata]|uniref:DUF1985 domain-containing protein n=1 Tax=Brassica carinata TaxID=52824 RepID=A0A8X7S3M2_BRACI|nr:hypothetical protein Bca52824_034622 [Brassica carinata]